MMLGGLRAETTRPLNSPQTERSCLFSGILMCSLGVGKLQPITFADRLVNQERHHNLTAELKPCELQLFVVNSRP